MWRNHAMTPWQRPHSRPLCYDGLRKFKIKEKISRRKPKTEIKRKSEKRLANWRAIPLRNENGFEICARYPIAELNKSQQKFVITEM